ncbi:MAG: hypothetical protein ABIH23_06045 [bacterium]
MKSIITDFSSGELSEKLRGRFDLDAYRKGCLTLENMFVDSRGMVSKRPGTIYQGVCDGVTAKSRIVPYVYSPDESYLIELTAGEIRWWRNGSAGGSSATPSWTAAQLFEIQFAQDHRGIYFAHHSYAPSALIRTALDTLTYGNINYLYYVGGTLTSHNTENAAGDDTLVATSAVSGLGAVPQQGLLKVKYSTGQYDEYTYTGWSGSSFTGIVPELARAYDNGDSIIVGHTYDSDNATVPFAGVNNYPRAISIFAGRFWFAGTDLDRQRIWASAAFGDTVDSGSLYLDMRMAKVLVSNREEQKEANRRYTSNATANLQGDSTIVIQEDIEADIPQTGWLRVIYQGGNADQYSYTSWASKTFSGVSPVLQNTYNGADYVLAGLWALPDVPETETKTYTRAVISDDVGIQIDIASDQNDAILWMAPGRDLFVGTTAAEWVIPRSVTARTPEARMESRAGSAEIQPRYVWDILPFLQSSKQQLRAYQYSQEGGGYKPPDLTILADHIMGAGGAVEFDAQKEPRSMVYFPRSDGQLAVLTYEPNANVLAWQRWIHSDATTTFISCAIVPESGEDTVYVTVKRGSKYYLEKFADPFPATQSACQNMDSIYNVTADSLSLVTGSTLMGATWLAGLTITVFEDGLEAGTEDVDASGNVDLSAYTGSQVYVGLPFTHKLQTMPIAQMVEAAMPLDDKRIVRGIFRLYHSRTFKTTTASTWGMSSAVDQYVFGDAWETADVEVEIPGTVKKDATFKVVGNDAYPLSIQAMVLEVDAEE